MHKSLTYGLKSLHFSRTVSLLNNNGSTPMNQQNFTSPQLYQQKRYKSTKNSLRHLVCLKEWDKKMINTVIYTALNLKYLIRDSHGIKLYVLPQTKVMILEDHNEPILRMAASKATSLLGADDIHIVSKIRWDQHYYGGIYSEMADIILVSTDTDGCVRRFIKQSSVPVVCMKSRKHASIQSMATIMSIIEEYGTLKSMNVSYVGSPHQVLNDYLILCPLLGANLNFKCCCSVCPVSPLLFQDCKDMCKKLDTRVEQITDTSKALQNAAVLIAGPTTENKEKLQEFTLCPKAIQKLAKSNWTFYHTCPRGKEVDDNLFWHPNARTYNAFKNMQYITAALIIFTMKGSQENKYRPRLFGNS